VADTVISLDCFRSW